MILYDGCSPVSCLFSLPPSLLFGMYGAIRLLLLPIRCYVACGVLLSLLVVNVSSSPHACIEAGWTPFLAASHAFTAASSASAFVALAAGGVALDVLARCAATASS